MKKKVIIVGDGGHAKVIIDIIQEMNNYEIIGITSISNQITQFCGYPVLGNDEILLEYVKNGVNNIALGIGGFKNNVLRTMLYRNFISLGLNVINVIHPNTIISKSVIMGNGVVIFPGVIINSEVRIGDNVIIATGSTIDHETIIGNNILISAGVTVGANTIINEGSLCALGSKIISGITIGKNCLIAAGAVVVCDVADNVDVFGVPAKTKKL